MDEGQRAQPRKAVSYRGRLRDVVYFQWYHGTRSPLLVAIDLAASGYITWIACSSLDEGFSPAIVMATWVVFFVIVFAAFFLLTFAMGLLSLVTIRDRTVLAESTIALYDDHFVARSEHATSECKWGIVWKLRRTRHYIVASISPEKAILIPRRAFPSAEEWDSFYDFMKARCEGVAVA